jgi:hypothetical protein
MALNSLLPHKDQGELEDSKGLIRSEEGQTIQWPKEQKAEMTNSDLPNTTYYQHLYSE